ncbi:hypothetical protein PC116_g13633 [Phytophthora cactorum]|nr:hypothetical protein PC120_g16318 [Phytophthora cactorum]KAG3129757.1 hypothetical protein C6341_g24008 [Phytophthora cactorum]KAG4036873.1 hypothetical protein PC123_g27558 [Phytophthora cactorum]KAG4238324.1 hypothetical protein PC116_g13633 [Phytophthora cactorum]
MYQDQYMKWHLESVIVPRRSFIRPELIVELSVPSYPVEPLPLVPKTTDWLAEAAALERRQPWRAAWVFAPFDHPYNTTYVPCHHDAPIFCSRTADPIAIGRAIMVDPSLTPVQIGNVVSSRPRVLLVNHLLLRLLVMVTMVRPLLRPHQSPTRLLQTKKRRIVVVPPRLGC